MFFCDEDLRQILVFNIWRGSLSQKVCSFKNVLRQSLPYMFEKEILEISCAWPIDYGKI